MILEGKATDLTRRLKGLYPDVIFPISVPAQMLDYQLLALYGLALQTNRKGAQILEIGTGQGASALMMAQAAPKASITSLTTNPGEKATAEKWWAKYGIKNCTAVVRASWDYLVTGPSHEWDMIFVDGDHNRIKRDMPWWNRLRMGGCFVCHDYSPATCLRPSPIVYATLNEWKAKLGREFEVFLRDDDSGMGMAGWFRRTGEVWN